MNVLVLLVLVHVTTNTYSVKKSFTHRITVMAEFDFNTPALNHLVKVFR